jgi:hypothetical protein
MPFPRVWCGSTMDLKKIKKFGLIDIKISKSESKRGQIQVVDELIETSE